MKFDEFDARMRVFETAGDTFAAPDAHLVARLDGRGFTRLTRDLHPFEAPYDERFRDLMVETARHLMDVGLRVVLATTHSDEISLLLHPDDQPFARKLRKLNSILAGEASARFSASLGAPAAFDCRISQLPDRDRVSDYFRWRQEDARRNALSAHCYWTARREGADALAATEQFRGVSSVDKIAFLAERGIHFDALPTWQKCGIVVRWGEVECTGINPLTGETVAAVRRELVVDLEVPRGAALGALVSRCLAERWRRATARRARRPRATAAHRTPRDRARGRGRAPR
jgi:tRNA(His) 5'-end guanylyltransferase